MEKLSFKLEVFEGPLDLLLHLISKNKLNIYDIPVAQLLEQYLEHIELMHRENIEVKSDFLAMASRLVYIKTAMLMPRKEVAEELKRELEGELIEYQMCRMVAQKLAQRANFDLFSRSEMEIEHDQSYKLHHDAKVIYEAYIAAVGRGKRRLPPSRSNFEKIVSTKIVSVPSKAIGILKRLYRRRFAKINDLFMEAESRSELVATFLALLELIRKKRIELDEEDTITLVNGGGNNWT